MKGRHPVSARIDVGAPGVYPIGGGLAASVRIDEFLFRRNWGGGYRRDPPYAGWAVRSAPPSPLGRLHQAHQVNRADIHSNRQCHVNLDEIRIPKLCLGGLWIFGSVSIGQSDWVLWATS